MNEIREKRNGRVILGIGKVMIETRKTEDSAVRATGQNHSHEKETIVLFSPDMDFCMSLRLLYQEKYEMVTTTDPEMILVLVTGFSS